MLPLPPAKKHENATATFLPARQPLLCRSAHSPGRRHWAQCLQPRQWLAAYRQLHRLAQRHAPEGLLAACGKARRTICAILRSVYWSWSLCFDQTQIRSRRAAGRTGRRAAGAALPGIPHSRERGSIAASSEEAALRLKAMSRRAYDGCFERKSRNCPCWISIGAFCVGRNQLAIRQFSCKSEVRRARQPDRGNHAVLHAVRNGNRILCPLLGVQAGTATPLATLGFLVSGVGLPIAVIASVSLAGSARALGDRIGKAFSLAFVTLAYLCIGPLLLGLIAVLVAGSFAAPAGDAGAPAGSYAASPIAAGFQTRYQTLNLLAALAFGYVIAMNVQSLGACEPRASSAYPSRYAMSLAPPSGCRLMFCRWLAWAWHGSCRRLQLLSWAWLLSGLQQICDRNAACPESASESSSMSTCQPIYVLCIRTRCKGSSTMVKQSASKSAQRRRQGWSCPAR